MLLLSPPASAAALAGQGDAPPDLALVMTAREQCLELLDVVPVGRDGETVELHAWYEAHLFNATEQAPQAKSVNPH